MGGLERGVREESREEERWNEPAPRESRRGRDVRVRAAESFCGDVRLDGEAASDSAVDSRRRRALRDNSRRVVALRGEPDAGEGTEASDSATDSRRRRALMESSRSMVETRGRDRWGVSPRG